MVVSLRGRRSVQPRLVAVLLGAKTKIGRAHTLVLPFTGESTEVSRTELSSSNLAVLSMALHAHSLLYLLLSRGMKTAGDQALLCAFTSKKKRMHYYILTKTIHYNADRAPDEIVNKTMSWHIKNSPKATIN